MIGFSRLVKNKNKEERSDTYIYNRVTDHKLINHSKLVRLFTHVGDLLVLSIMIYSIDPLWIISSLYQLILELLIRIFSFSIMSICV